MCLSTLLCTVQAVLVQNLRCWNSWPLMMTSSMESYANKGWRSNVRCTASGFLLYRIAPGFMYPIPCSALILPRRSAVHSYTNGSIKSRICTITHSQVVIGANGMFDCVYFTEEMSSNVFWYLHEHTSINISMFLLTLLSHILGCYSLCKDKILYQCVWLIHVSTRALENRPYRG